MYREKIKKRVEYLQKKSSGYLHVFTKCSLFIVPPPPPRPPPPPMLAFSECVGNTGRLPASKNPSVPSGTWLAGDRPVIQTESSPRANAIRPDSLLDWHGSMVETAVLTFGA